MTAAFPDRRGVFAGLWTAAWAWRGRTAAALALLLAAKAAAVLVPLALKAIVDRFSGSAAPPPAGAEPGVAIFVVLPVFLLLGYALLRFASTLFNELRDLIFAPVTQRIVTGLAERTFAHLLALGPRFHTTRSTGALIRDVERGTGGVGFLLGAGLFTVLPTLVEFGAVLAVLAAGYSGRFTLIVTLTFLAYAALTTALTAQRELRQRAVNTMDSRANARLVDGLLNYETVKTHAREDHERQRYAAICGEWATQAIANQRALSVLHIGQSAVIAAGVAAVMLLAGEQVQRGTMTVGDLVLVNAYVIQICLPLNALGFVFREARDALVNAENLFALLAQRPEIEDKPGAQSLRLEGGHVVFEHVDFGYETGRQILRDVSLEIPPGQTLAVVGGSGSGKSTLARLLLRLYDVGAGRITIDGQDLRGLRLATLREAIGVVPQDTVLFNDTIAANIGYGRLSAGMSEIIDAAKAAQVHEFILSLPQQYDTVVGERGLKLSGGEKQRIAIARAFLKNPPIMVFDEATSALDTRAERAIQAELDRIAQGRTALVIAHRLSTIVGADQIVVMDGGRIVERGRHDELLAAGGLYAQLWALQLQQREFERLERRLARQPVDLAALLADVIEGLREAFEARQVRLYTEIDAGSARVTGDPSTLGQALRELCMWSLQATPRGGRIEIALSRHEGQARLAITDGRPAGDAAPAGPRPGELPALYGTDTPLDPLALRSTVERQGGRFTITPPDALGGMRHVIELPLRAVDGGAARASREPAPVAQELPSLDGLRVLLVDDVADARETLAALLQLHGARTLAFGSGREAIDWLAAQPTDEWPSVLVSDIVLGRVDGGEDGHAVMQAIRQLEIGRGIPLSRRLPAVALTGLAQPGDRVRALMTGFQQHLAKPVDPAELVSTLHALAGRATDDASAASPPTTRSPDETTP